MGKKPEGPGYINNADTQSLPEGARQSSMLKKRPPSQSTTQEFPRVVNGVMKFRGLWEHPDQDILSQMLEAAQQEQIQVVEQQWTLEHQSLVYVLKCTCGKGEEPVWTLSTGALGRPLDEKWRHQTGDVSLVLNLVTSESTGTNLSDLISSSKQMVVAPAQQNTLPAVPQRNEHSVTSTSMPAAPDPAIEKQPDDPKILQGDLVLLRLPSVLQSIRMSNMTGRLELRDQANTASIFFSDGNPVHAEFMGSLGDLAMIELLSWQTGQFRFHPTERTSERTIKNRLDSLLMEGMTFADQSAVLEQNGLSLNSFLIRKRPDLKQKEFEEIVKNGPPIDMRQAMNLYCQIDDTISLLELLRVVPIHRTEWTPILFNFISQNLIALSDRPARNKKVLPDSPQGADMASAEAAMRGCIRAETGIYTYGAFLHLVHQEFLRHEAGGPPFSVVIIEARLKRKGEQPDYLPENGVKEMVARIKGLIRPFETLAHFGTFDYALLLPQTELKTAALVAQRLVLSLRTIPKVDWDLEYCFYTGVAGVPGDGKEVAALIAAANEAKAQAVRTETSVCMFRTLLG